QAKANIQRSQADLGQMQAKLYQSDRDFKRMEKLRDSGGITEVEHDAAQAALESAKSALAVGKATVVQNQAAQLDAEAAVAKTNAVLTDARAALETAQTNLGYCTITSPVKGVIVDRRVNVGQTVVASLKTPSLFLIANDLTRMQVWLSVNEADIGRVHRGLKANFKVDAYPDKVFHGMVTQ